MKQLNQIEARLTQTAASDDEIGAALKWLTKSLGTKFKKSKAGGYQFFDWKEHEFRLALYTDAKDQNLNRLVVHTYDGGLFNSMDLSAKTAEELIDKLKAKAGLELIANQAKTDMLVGLARNN